MLNTSSRCLAGVAVASLLMAVSAHAQYTLTLFHNNDGESSLLNAGSGLSQYGGIDRFVSLLNQERSTAQLTSGVLTLSSGDNFLAGNAFNASLETGPLGSRTYYDAIGLTKIDYDAIILGNHDFDFGPALLNDFMNQVPNATYLSANLDFGASPLAGQLGTKLKSSEIFNVSTPGSLSPVKVGIVGATTPMLPTISSPGSVTVKPDLVNIVQTEIDNLRSAGAQHVILVSHLQSVLEDKNLISQLTGVTAAIAGGGDEILANPGTPLVPGDSINGPYPTLTNDKDGNAIPIVTTGGNYKYVGKLELEFDASGNLLTFDGGPLRVASLTADPVNGVVPDAATKTEVVDPVAAFVDGLNSLIVGDTAFALNGVRPEVRTKETNLGNLIADAYLAAGIQFATLNGETIPDIALTNAGGIRASINAGPITRAEVNAVLAFSNLVGWVDLDTERLLEVLENALSRIEFIDGRFAQISGMIVEYFPDYEGGQRVRRVTLADGTVLIEDGQVVLNRSLRMVTNRFSAGGGDSYPLADLLFTNFGTVDNQALADYIGNDLGGKIPEEYRTTQGRIVVVPEPATVALFGLLGLGAFTLLRRRTRMAA